MGVLFSQEACNACSRFSETTSQALAQYSATLSPTTNTTTTPLPVNTAQVSGSQPTYNASAGMHPDD